MSNDPSWERISAVFDQVLDRSRDQRSLWLAEHCADDEKLQREVKALLRAHDRAEGILDGPLGPLAGEALAADEAPVAQDQLIGPFRIVAEIGRGGMGVVYQAEDRRLGRFVALKFLPASLTANELAKKRFLTEARAVSSLDHPNICTVHDVGQTDDGGLYLAMAFYEGETLTERLRSGPLPATEAVNIAIQVARGLQHAHDRGVVHRDIKPSNIFLTSRGEVKILDFGLARRGLTRLTEAGTRLGTVSYMSPEQALAKEVDQRTDIWSLGVTIYEMVCGRKPFSGEHEAAVLYSIVNEDAAPLEKTIPPGLREVVARAMQRDQELRFKTATELERALDRVVSKAVGKIVRGRRRHVPLLAAAAVVMAILAVAIVWMNRTDRPPGVSLAPLAVAPVTSFPGAEELPALSPDGQQVAYSWTGPSQDNFDIYVQPLGRPAPLRLSSDPRTESSPAWSPSGEQIAFLREAAGGRSDVVIVGAQGGEQRVIGNVEASARDGVSWTLDALSLAVPDRISADRPSAIVLIKVADGEKALLAEAPARTMGAVFPVFSPDGKTLAFDVIHGAWLGDSYLVNSDGSSLRRLTKRRGQPGGIAWSSDGRELFIARLSRDSRRYIVRVSADGGAETELALGENPSEPAMGPNSGRLVFSKRVTRYDIARMRPTRDAGPPERFLPSTQFDGNPQYSPDGSRIAFSSSRSGDIEIWVCNADGSELRRLSSAGSAGSPRWSPDGEWIAFDSTANGYSDVFVIASKGGPARRLTTDDSHDVVPGWSQDGRWIYFSSNRGGDLQIWKIDAAGQERPVQITQGGGLYGAEGPDGRVYYANKRGTVSAIWSASPIGGEEKAVVPEVSSGWGCWQVSERGIYYLAERPNDLDKPWGIFFYDFATKLSEELATFHDSPTRGGPGFSVSPDGEWVLLGQLSVESDLLVTEINAEGNP